MASPPPPPPLQQFAAPSKDPVHRDPSSSSSSFAHISRRSNGLKQKDRIAEEEGVCLVAYSNDDHIAELRDGSMGLMPHDFHSGSLEGREREQEEEDDDMVQEKAKMNLKSSNPKNPRRGRSDLVGGAGGRREDLAGAGEGSAQGAPVGCQVRSPPGDQLARVTHHLAGGHHSFSFHPSSFASPSVSLKARNGERVYARTQKEDGRVYVRRRRRRRRRLEPLKFGLARVRPPICSR